MQYLYEQDWLSMFLYANTVDKMKQTKKIKHDEIEICKLSKKKIDTTKDNYTIILDCQGKEIHGVGFYRHEEFSNFIEGKTNLVTKQLLNKQVAVAENLLAKFGIKAPEKYQIV